MENRLNEWFVKIRKASNNFEKRGKFRKGTLWFLEDFSNYSEEKKQCTQKNPLLSLFTYSQEIRKANSFSCVFLVAQ